MYATGMRPDEPDEVDIDAAPVSRLIAGRLPRWAGLPVRRLRSIPLVRLPYRWDTDPAPAANSRHVIKEILAERAPRGRRSARARPPSAGRDPSVVPPARAGVTRPRTPSPGRRCRACPSTAWPSWRGPPSPGPGR
ncbi:hypothetical protein DIZ27_26300 [Streptomyces sp. NWU339]|nr:hypothetical protein DIZ27_26300 [Streptomyces sp. NWU339]